MTNEENIITQPKNKRPKERGKRTSNQQGALLHNRQNSAHGVRYFSMFTGVGGFELGLEGANDVSSKQLQTQSRRWNEDERKKTEQNSSFSSKKSRRKSNFLCVGFSEIDKYASELLSKKFPSVKNWGDATKINPSELPDFDMLCGGFPCQAFSIAGKRRGFEDTRGTLFFDIARIIKIKRPKIVLLENVKGLLNHNSGQTFRKIIQTFSELGYDVQWLVLNSKFHGVPQNRERVFIIGSLRGTSRPEILPLRETTNEDKPAMQFKGGVKSGEMWLEDGKYFSRNYPQGQRIYGTEGISAQINAQGGGWGAKTGLYQTDKMKIRRLTPTECERLQGFPDNWTSGFSDTQRYKMMGNAVTVNVIRAIANKLAPNIK